MAIGGADGRLIEDKVFTAQNLALGALALVAGYAVFLGFVFLAGGWFRDAAGGAVRTDFLVFWSAGGLALAGDAAASYDWAAIAAAELQTASAASKTLPWVYPPTFLLAVAPFALVPYIPAFLAWIATTVAAYLATLHAIVPRRPTLLLALAAPPVLWNALSGQNGFLTAALLGGSLVFLDRRPAVAGLLLGFLTYKPQLGLLFPLVLMLTGRWRVVGVATLTALAMVGVSYLAFGAEAWAAFFRSGSMTADAEFGAKFFTWPNLHSVYGLFRWAGAGATLAWTVQGVAALATAVIVCRMWLQPVAYRLKAAALSTGTLIVTPYILTYDLAALAVPVAFLAREGLSTGFIRGERAIVAALACALLLRLLFFDLIPIGPILMMTLLAVTVVRIAWAAPAILPTRSG